eukprot:scaffold234461_cov44-Prasinocladus_malaysianus.AAC.1
MAIHHRKPLVVLVLDQEGWDLITGPGGAERVKGEADSQMTTSAWNDTQHGLPLCSYHGEDIVPGKPMSLGLLAELIQQLASVNLCNCRPAVDDPADAGMLALAAEFVQQDLTYYKQHAQLKSKAGAWEYAVQEGGPKPLLQKEEALYWRGWLQRSVQDRMVPEPTPPM